MSEPIRILQVVTYMGRGGLETMLMNYYRNIDRSKVQFDFLTHRSEKADYDDEIEALGGKIYHLPRLNPFSRSYLSALDRFFKEHSEYQVVHCHQDCLSGVVLKVAKANGVKFTIAHAHSASQDKNLKYLIKVIAKKNIKKYSDQLFACGDEAGKWMFETDDFKVINNAIDTDLYTYNKEKSLEVRRKLGIEGKFVVGHVGRFNYPKNHKFIVDVFDEVCKIEPDSVLMLVGDGDLRSEIEDKVKALGLEDKVKFMGVRSDVNELMQAMDVYIMPSLYEGLPLALVEAQTASLPCIISDNVGAGIIINDLVKKLPLNENIDLWIKQLEECKMNHRTDRTKQIINAGFDVKSNVVWLEKFYQKNWKK